MRDRAGERGEISRGEGGIREEKEGFEGTDLVRCASEATSNAHTLPGASLQTKDSSNRVMRKTNDTLCLHLLHKIPFSLE